MNYHDFISTFKNQVYRLHYDKGLDFGLKVSRELMPEYITFSLVHNWGDPKVLKDAIELCARPKALHVDIAAVREMAAKVDAVTPEMDDYGDLIASYALNACVAVYYSLQYLLDHDPSHLYNIGISYTDTVDFKVQGDRTLTESEIEAHPDMINAWNFTIKETQ